MLLHRPSLQPCRRLQSCGATRRGPPCAAQPRATLGARQTRQQPPARSRRSRGARAGSLQIVQQRRAARESRRTPKRRLLVLAMTRSLRPIFMCAFGCIHPGQSEQHDDAYAAWSAYLQPDAWHSYCLHRCPYALRVDAELAVRRLKLCRSGREHQIFSSAKERMLHICLAGCV